jgi:RNA polymerase sigma-70 factor, ECF subfamily
MRDSPSAPGELIIWRLIALNRAVAVAEVHGAAAALALIESLGLDRYYLYHAIRADLLRRLGRAAEAVAAYEAAIAGTQNAAERAFLRYSRDAAGQVRPA